MRCLKVPVLGLALLGGCSQYGYRYQPSPQVLYSPIFADYREQDHVIDICIDTNGLQLKQVEIIKSDGTIAKPTSVDYPQLKSQLMRGIQEDIYGPQFADGPTIAHFDKDEIGPSPWNVRLNIQATPPATIQIGGPAPIR